jgi:hypothetical protein
MGGTVGTGGGLGHTVGTTNVEVVLYSLKVNLADKSVSMLGLAVFEPSQPTQTHEI